MASLVHALARVGDRLVRGYALVVLALCGTVATAAPEDVLLPSGISARLYEVIGQGTNELRLRYVSSGFDPLGADPETLLSDMTFLCENSVLPGGVAAETSPRVIISIADRTAEFGVLNTDVRQSFEAFTIDGDTCIWEAF
jgi:hypothetical protein